VHYAPSETLRKRRIWWYSTVLCRFDGYARGSAASERRPRTGRSSYSCARIVLATQKRTASSTHSLIIDPCHRRTPPITRSQLLAQTTKTSIGLINNCVLSYLCLENARQDREISAQHHAFGGLSRKIGGFFLFLLFFIFLER
jgi:hypothetical protein